MAQRKYKTDLPTQYWSIHKMRTDVVRRLSVVAKVLKVSSQELTNTLLDKGLIELEAGIKLQQMEERYKEIGGQNA